MSEFMGLLFGFAFLFLALWFWILLPMQMAQDRNRSADLGVDQRSVLPVLAILLFLALGKADPI